MNLLRGVQLNELPCDYTSELPAVRHLYKSGGLTFRKPVTFFVGENGSGKSTLLEAIADAQGLNAEGGSRDTLFTTRTTHASLSRYLTLIRSNVPKDSFFLRAESFYNTASYLEDNGYLIRYGGVSFHRQSHGESFLALVENRFEGKGLYLLDEPEAALSPQRQLSLLVLLDELVKERAQFIIATHSPILMAYPNAEILQFSEKGIHPVDYKDTDHYIITRRFLNDPERMLKYLLE